MRVTYYPETDSMVISASQKEAEAGIMGDKSSIVLSFAEEQGGTVTAVDVFGVTGYHLPLAPERGYDAATDTLTLGERPVGDCRVVDSGEFVTYLQPDPTEPERYEEVALDIRNASKHLGEVNETIIRKLKQESDKLG